MRIASCMQMFMTEHQKQVAIETNYVIVRIRTNFEGVVSKGLRKKLKVKKIFFMKYIIFLHPKKDHNLKSITTKCIYSKFSSFFIKTLCLYSTLKAAFLAYFALKISYHIAYVVIQVILAIINLFLFYHYTFKLY